ncbi:hypothetical protein MXM41_12350 [Leclercia adecarboxylata]|uniref:hypothetical protein n=1 Tax=Leclercia adecarboxylata TaxID=83655 RepID=UPI002DBF1B4B|nr:hypothetical protein [Leclercia adecarboxylata]MEB6379715.1 hypothetical protein [Leclercia adecarboxylata]
MKRYDDYHQQVPATQPHDGFLFEPVTSGARAGEKVQQKRAVTPLLKNAFPPYKDVK